MLKLVSSAIIALLVSTSAYAQDKTSEVDKIFNFATAETPGCAVGVSQNGKVVVNRSYGLANVERKLPLTQSSRRSWRSCPKQTKTS
jgi:CubicO group peptidase (beta-lactamase class C family)